MKYHNQLCVLLLLAVILLGGCSTYTTPGAPADFSKLGLTPEAKAALTDASVQKVLEKKPLVTFPASIAVARVQAGNYDAYWYQQYRSTTPHGAYSVITVRDVETDDDLAALGKLPQVTGVVSMKRILLDNNLNTDLELRNAAAKLHASLLLYYTFDTIFEDEHRVVPLGLITLGLFPNHKAKVTCTASAVLMDVNNGYVYTVVEATSKDDQLANAWGSAQAMDDVRHKAERKAYEGLLAKFKSEWPVVVATYSRAVTPAATVR